jgi:hypothetical protein
LAKKAMSEVFRFNYTYHDNGNRQEFGSKLLSNPEHLSLKEIERKIHENLLDHKYFYPNRLEIKRFKPIWNLDDYSWYVFESVELVDRYVQNKKLRSINRFCSLLEKMNDFNTYLMGDQPTTCPICGARTETMLELLNSPILQFHVCLSEDCRYIFFLEEDLEPEIWLYFDLESCNLFKKIIESPDTEV